MSVTIHLNYPAAIPVGHVIEVTEFADTRPEKKRTLGSPNRGEAFRIPVILDLDTGIRYMNERHTTGRGALGNVYDAPPYPTRPSAALPVERVYRARVTACTLVRAESTDSLLTTLIADPLPDAAPGS
ncbi:hypothetical protein [Streptomyces laurentii]|uniref:hypothetical protein n=1 Tax=Streptomyces laurentii TaxID=39478 RepID=UPI003697CDA4